MGTKRERECSVRDLIGHEGCQGDNFEYKECNEHIECPMWSSWSAPTECYYIGDPETGERDRTRYCKFGLIGSLSCPFERRIQTSPCQVCDISITRPRVYVRRASVTLRVSMKTSITWEDEMSNPDSDLAKEKMAMLQEELNKNAALTAGQTINVVGLKLCPPSGCDRRKREAEKGHCYADVEITDDCDDAEEGDCEDTLNVLAETKSALCEDGQCEVIESEVTNNEKPKNKSKDSGASQLSYLLSLFTVSLFFLIN